jgi:hypothetical protein
MGTSYENYSPGFGQKKGLMLIFMEISIVFIGAGNLWP